MLRTTALTLLFLGFARLVWAGDPATALAEARKAIEGRDYDRAISLLRAALPDAKDSADAQAAIHFYSSLAYSNNGDAASARSELLLFGEIHKGKNTLDPKKYPPAFLALFNEVAAHPEGVPPQSFEAHYPGFAAMTPTKAKALEVAVPLWGSSAEMQLLASDKEKREWGTLRNDDARRDFIATFWASRDPDSGTPVNEWREVFNRRVAFADATFATGNDMLRGSLTDRGRVFVLLGPPAHVYVSNIGRRQGGFLQVNGTQERWVYFKQQLPPAMSQTVLEIRFIDQPAYGDHVLERDFLPLRALAEAKKTLTGQR